MPVPEYIRRMRAKVGQDLIMVVGAAAVICDADGQILLQERADYRVWGIPGGIMEPGEDPAAAVIREVREETGLHVIPERIVGVYGGQDHLITYPNGDQVAVTSITFLCRVIGGTLQVDRDESLALRWFPADNLPENILPHHIPRIHHAFNRDTPFFRLPNNPET